MSNEEEEDMQGSMEAGVSSAMFFGVVVSLPQVGTIKGAVFSEPAVCSPELSTSALFLIELSK